MIHIVSCGLGSLSSYEDHAAQHDLSYRGAHDGIDIVEKAGHSITLKERRYGYIILDATPEAATLLLSLGLQVESLPETFTARFSEEGLHIERLVAS